MDPHRLHEPLTVDRHHVICRQPVDAAVIEQQAVDACLNVEQVEMQIGIGLKTVPKIGAQPFAAVERAGRIPG